MRILNTLVVSMLLTLVLAATHAAQSGFDVSKIPASGTKTADFVPDGWKVAAEAIGDLNGDRKADRAVTLIQDIPDKEVNRDRVLVILFSVDDGTFRNAAVAEKLLQCTSCGGAFYGVMDAPAEVSIGKGVLIISQEHGSREVTETTYRFRYDEQPGKIILIGFDYSSVDRLTGVVSTESTNYLTGRRITTVGKGKRTRKRTTTVAKTRYSIEEVDHEQFDADATQRLGLD